MEDASDCRERDIKVTKIFYTYKNHLRNSAQRQQKTYTPISDLNRASFQHNLMTHLWTVSINMNDGARVHFCNITGVSGGPAPTSRCREADLVVCDEMYTTIHGIHRLVGKREGLRHYTLANRIAYVNRGEQYLAQRENNAEWYSRNVLLSTCC